jgi:uncharacterized membrane protein YphA (DoxX/SURF4 family)
MKKNLQNFLFGSSLNASNLVQFVWLIFRVHIGLSLAINAGLPKMQEGLAPDWFVKQVGEIGFTFISPTFWATIASWGEFIGGICLALGLLTRFSALQLAFQFFVISFIWYDKPMPVVGMYFQQTLFWGYVLAAFLGGGKYSLDYLITNKKSKVKLNAKVAMLLCLVFFISNCNAQSRPLNGSGIIVTKKYSYSNFDKINIQDVPGKIIVEVGKPFSIETEADDNLASLLSIVEKDGELQVALEGNRNNKMYIEETNVRIKISMPEVSVIHHSANSTLLVNGVLGRYFRIKNNENGNATINGSIDELDIVCSGNGLVNAKGMVAKKINVKKRGNGNVYINAEETFSATGSGNGDVINIGKGKADESSAIMGNGEIKYPNQPQNKTANQVTKWVATVIKNETDKTVEFTVKYSGKGSYGIEVKAKDSLQENFPVGTRLFKGNQFTTFKKAVYKVTESAQQTFIIKED